MVSKAHHAPLKLKARVAGAARDVEIVEVAPHRYDVTIDGTKHHVDTQTLRSGVLSLLIDHRSHTVDVRSEGDRHRVDVGGRTVEVMLIDELRHGGVSVAGDAAEGPQEIRALMPGKVVTTLVKIGDEVTSGQGLLVVEAMKMENEVKAPAAGVVKELRVEAGQAVEAGEVLARIE